MISGIFTIKNGITGGYFFPECIISAMPFCDELLLNDGGSTDGTLDVLKRLKDTFPEKRIEIFNIRDVPHSKNWESIDIALNALMERCENPWIFEIQGDELFHEKDLPIVKNIVSEANRRGCNSVRHYRMDRLWTVNHPIYEMQTMRIIRNLLDIKSYFGGDHFVLGNIKKPKDGFTVHNVPPEYETKLSLYHYSNAFVGNNMEKCRRHAEDLTNGEAVDRIGIYENLKKNMPKFMSREKIEKITPSEDCPSIIKGCAAMYEYRVREEIFDKNWLRNVMNP